jgi:hypothetical protein
VISVCGSKGGSIAEENSSPLCLLVCSAAAALDFVAQVLRSPGQIKLIGLDPRLHGAEWREIQKASMEARGARTRDLTPRLNNMYKLAFGAKQ